MREARNPFRLRASEQIESDVVFLRLFGPAMLTSLRLAQQGVECFRIIRSAPGGGKTTLMRLFTPGPLKALCAHKEQMDFKELYGALHEIGVVDDQDPRLLGAMLSCSRTFADIADMGLERVKERHMFFALLDARLVLSGLRSLLSLRNCIFPNDLEKVRVSVPPTIGSQFQLSGSCDGRELYDWARTIEDRICSVLFSFDPPESIFPGHDSLIAPILLAASNVSIENRRRIEQVIFMLDDAHRLASWQRKDLIDLLVNLRAPTGVWVSERLEALEPDELIRSGATAGRDYADTVLLEDHWRRKRNDFPKLLANIADRRARSASDVGIDMFSGCLASTLDMVEWKGKLQKAQMETAERVEKLSKGRTTFGEWIDECRSKEGSLVEIALAWRGLEILIRRELRRHSQQEFEFAFDKEQYRRRDDASLRNAAEVFLSREHQIPYYYGFERLATLASSNVEQFLMLAGDKFEECVSLALIQKPTVLSAARQHDIAVLASKRLWEEIPRRAGEDVDRLLRAVVAFSEWFTFRPTAPNDPGVNGVAILMDDRRKLLDPSYLAKKPEHRTVADVVARAMQFNLLEPVLDYRCKGRLFMVLNLNRLLCAAHGLPLGRGLFKEQSLDTLSNWLQLGFQRPKETDTFC